MSLIFAIHSQPQLLHNTHPKEREMMALHDMLRSESVRSVDLCRMASDHRDFDLSKLDQCTHTSREYHQNSD